MASKVILYAFVVAFILGGIGFVFIFPHTTTNTLLLKESQKNNNAGFWGERSSEFDWCEYNYQHSYYIAETYNTLTGFSYVIVGLFQYYYYNNLIQYKTPKKVKKSLLFLVNPWLSIFNISLGLGTMLFHCTLKYAFELYDELAMMHLLAWIYICLIQRNERKTNGKFAWISHAGFVWLWSIIVTIWGIGSYVFDLQILHKWYRIIGTFGFISVTILAFWNTATAVDECKHMFKKPKISNGFHKYGSKFKMNIDFVEIYFNRSGGVLIFAVICWMIENAFCHYTNILQLHAFIWHLFSCIGIYYALQIIICHRLCFHKNELTIKSIDIIPHVLSYITFS